MYNAIVIIRTMGYEIMEHTQVLTTQEIKAELFNEYVRADRSEKIDALKGELYRRGHRRMEVVAVALASLMRRRRAG